MPLNAIAGRLEPGQDLRRSLEQLCVARHIHAACVLSAVGSLSAVAIRFAGADAATRLEGPFEILSLSGTLSRHGVHLHLMLADRHGRVLGGHLAEGAPVSTTVEVVLGELDGATFARREDPRTGHRELVVHPGPPAGPGSR